MRGEQGPLGQPRVDGLGHSEVDDLRDGPTVLVSDEHIGRLQVSVHDALDVGVLYSVTDLREDLETI